MDNIGGVIVKIQKFVSVVKKRVGAFLVDYSRTGNTSAI